MRNDVIRVHDAMFNFHPCRVPNDDLSGRRIEHGNPVAGYLVFVQCHFTLGRDAENFRHDMLLASMGNVNIQKKL